MSGENNRSDNGPMLNAYPDSMGGTLGDIVSLLKKEEFHNVFSSFYILPSVFHTDLDRGFSVIDYSLNKMLAKREDLKELEALGVNLKLDFILNHASVLSPQFQDLLKNGEKSEYKDFFIDWNRFWEGHGTMTEEGYIQPDAKLIADMFFRKPGLPILMVRFPDGRNVPYWNTFYQEVRYPALDAQDIMRALPVQYGEAEYLAQQMEQGIAAGKRPASISLGECEEYRAALTELLESGRKYLGQMDLNIKSPKVWEFYEETLKTLASYGAKIVRLDAFAYAPKEPGAKNFLNEPGTWELLERVQELAQQYGLSLLPEIHAAYEQKIYEKIAEKGYMTYDFFLPGLLIDSLERADGATLAAWAEELQEKKIRTVNMLGCHDGIPLLDLKGMIPAARIEALIDTVVSRGGMVKDLHGQKNVYYQVNATYYSALGEDDRKLLLARAVQLFMPGKPQIWYLDLFAGKNDRAAVGRVGAAGHKEINRTNLSCQALEDGLSREVVRKQLDLLRFRKEFPAFGFDAALSVENEGSRLRFVWKKDGCTAVLSADLKTAAFAVEGQDERGERVFEMTER